MYNNKHHQFATQYNHKLFAHVNRWGNDVTDYVDQLKPKIIKFLDSNTSNVQMVRDLIPDALLIYRRWQPSQPLGDTENEAYQIGVDFGQEIAEDEIVQRGLVDLVEGYNEVLGETAPGSEHRKYAKFMLGFKDGLGNSPVEPIAFNFGTGNMRADLILEYYGAVLDSYDWLGFHEYDWPTMDRLHRLGLADGNDGMWLSLRYRRIMQPIIETLGSHWSVVITECGMTQGVLGGNDVGFMYPNNTISGDWAGYPTPISNDDYWQTLRWYSGELMKDDYVAGACMFTTGALSPWESFEAIGTITPKLEQFQQINNGDDMKDDMDLKILKLDKLEGYESYQLPFRVQAIVTITAIDIFVDDVRDNDDNSLNLVPRITTFEQLKSVFKLDIDQSLGKDATPTGDLYWAIIGFYVRSGAAAFIPKVLAANGNPVAPPGAFVYAHWPSADPFPGAVNPNYHSNAVGGFTNINGDIGFGYGDGAVVGENGGVYDIWVSADPPQGTRFYSDMAIRLGWFGGTDHLTANPIFQAVRKGSTPPPSGDAKLVVFDASGDRVGEVALVTGQGTGGRIALFSGSSEQSYVELE